MPLFGFNFLNEKFAENLVNILTTELIIALNCFDLDLFVFNGEDRYIEGTSSKIKDAQFSWCTIVLDDLNSVSNRCCSWFVDDSLAVEAGNLSSLDS